MKVQIVPATAIRSVGRLDTRYFLSQSQSEAKWSSLAKAAGVRFVRLGGKDGLGKVWAPKRFKRAYAVEGEASVPYLRPHDVFNYLPEPADLLSRERSAHLKTYELRPGMILQTCSGRNLGPAVMVDAWLSRFVLSHDMVRIEVESESVRAWVLAYLKSRKGQQFLRRDKTGSVIDHLTDEHVGDQEIPFPDDGTVDTIARKIQQAISLREKARLQLAREMERYTATLPPLERTRKYRTWTLKSSRFDGRLDAAYYEPVIDAVRKRLKQAGGQTVAEVADVFMLGRYKRLYTDGAHGRPIISGAQLLQSSPIHVQYILPQSFDDVGDFELKEGWIAYPSDGRAEEALGTPVIVTKDKAGWLASNMVGRVVPKPGVDVGWLYVALRTLHSQMQLKSFASGSVVDHTYPDDMNKVILPPRNDFDGADVLDAWRMLSKAQVMEDEAVAAVDRALAIDGPTQTAS